MRSQRDPFGIRATLLTWLERVDLLQSWRRERHALYAADYKGTRGLIQFVMEDYCKANFAVSLERSTTGISHPGLQAENDEELAEIETPVEAAGGSLVRAEEIHGCFYARTRQGWVTDARGVHWEAFMIWGDTDTMARTVLIDA